MLSFSSNILPYHDFVHLPLESMIIFIKIIKGQITSMSESEDSSELAYFDLI